MFYYWLDSPELAIRRVAHRVKRGEHHVPDEDIRRRYARSVRNFVELYRPVADHWEVYDNTSGEPKLLGMGDWGEEDIDNEYDWAEFLRSADDA